jgi:hypothetical protein
LMIGRSFLSQLAGSEGRAKIPLAGVRIHGKQPGYPA